MDLIINDISKTFNRISILKNLFLTVESGKTIGITGENGSGKTTLLKIIAGLMWPESGFGFLGKTPIFTTESEVRKHMIYWGHHTDLYLNMTAYENMNLFLNLRGNSRKNNVINSAINSVGLEDSFEKILGEYSEGMVQRYHIARLKLSSWKIAIIDEPTNALDKLGLEILDESISEFKNKDKTLLISSHNNAFLKSNCDQIYQLENGKLEQLS